MYKFNLFVESHFGYREYAFIETEGSGVMIFHINTNSLVINITRIIVNPRTPAVIASLFDELDRWIKEYRPDTTEIRLVTDNKSIITTLLQREWLQVIGEVSSTMIKRPTRIFRDTFGDIIKLGDNVVFINDNCLVYGEVTDIDIAQGILYIQELKEGSKRTFTHQWVSGNDPTIQVRHL